MLHTVTLRALAIAMCGWLLAGEAAALTLGRARGAVLIGRALDVTIPVTLDGAQADSPCPSAELFHGDNRFSGAVSARWEATGPGQGVVRVTTSAPVDEPMVTVYLRIGCSQPVTRRYVLLSELPPLDEPAARTPGIQPPVVAAPPARAQAQARSQSVPASTPAPDLAPPRRAASAAPVPRARRAAAPAPAPQPRARLRLEPLDLTVDRDPTLRFSSELGAPTAADPQQRQAWAALWQALQKDPQQSVEEALRLQGVEREVGSLREAARQNTAAIAQMRTQVDQARSDRNLAAWLVIGLSAVLAALLAAIGWRWHRARELERVGRWFEANSVSADAAMLPTAPGPVATVPAAPRKAQPPVARVPAVPAAAVVPVAAASRSRNGAPTTGGPSTFGGGLDFAASRGGTVRMVGVEELIDVHDKADFFLSIGETDQAVAVLEAHVHDQVETGALAWMDLLELYHSLGRRADYERLRAEFSQRFTGQVPDFEHFDQPSASLEGYSRALSRIVALWPSPKVLDVIEESIFRKPGLAGAEPFSLEAYRELVLLYHIARDMAPAAPDSRAGTGPATTGFSDTSLQPLNLVERPEGLRPTEPALTDRERLMIPPPSARLGVDIDLEEPEPREAGLDFDISGYDAAGAGESQDRRD